MSKKYFVYESLDEFAGKRGRPRKARAPRAIAGDPEEEGDDWYNADDEFDSDSDGPSAADIEDVEIEDEAADAAIMKKVTRMLNNELSFPEFNRGALKFRIRNSGETVSGVPMASMSGGSAFLFKTPTGMKKVKLEDIIVESFTNEKKFVSESFQDYE